MTQEGAPSTVTVFVVVETLCYLKLRNEALCGIVKKIEVASIFYALICIAWVAQIDDDGSILFIGRFFDFYNGA